MKRLLSVLLVVLLAIGFAFTASAEDSASGTCGENLTWEYDDATGTLTISGTGEMYDYVSYNNRPWEKYKDGIKSVVIGDNVTSIGNLSFNNFNALTNVKTGNGVTSIGNQAFFNCSALTGELVIPDNVTSIGSNAFKGCAVTSVKLGKGIKTLGADEFPYACIASFSVSDESPYFCAEDGVIFSKDKSAVFRYPMAKQGNYVLPDSVKVIKSYAFGGFNNKLIINTAPDEIEPNAFVSADQSVRTNFSLYFMAGEPLLSYADSFNRLYHTVYYLNSTEDKWTFDENGLWNGLQIYPYEDGETVEFDPDLYIASGYCGDNFSDGKNLAWMIDENGTLTIKGKGYMRNYSHKKFHTGDRDITDAPWSDYYYDVNTLVIEDGVMGIGHDAFFVMDSFKGKLILPDSLRYVGQSAFGYCSGFEGGLALPEGMRYLESMAFIGCNGISSLKIPSSFSGDFSFEMGGLLEINIHGDNKFFCSVDNVVFSKDMKELIFVPQKRTGSYTVPETVETIKISALRKSMLSGIILPAGYTEDFNNTRFDNAESLENITYHKDNVKYCSVDGAVFTKDGKTLLYVPKGKSGTYTVPETVETIAKNSFNKTSLSTIVIPENVKTIEGEAISTPMDKYVSVIIKANKTEMKRYCVKASNGGSKIGAGIYFLNGEPTSDKRNNIVSGPVSLYYLAGTEDKWTFDENNLWYGLTVTKFYGFGVEDTTDHSNHNTETKNKLDCTCTDYGYTGNKFCADCNTVYEIGNITSPCHNHTLTTVVSPTCTESGYSTYTCECGDKYTVDSDATGHSVNSDGVCDTCGELIEEPTVLDRIIKTFKNIFAFTVKLFLDIFNFLYGVFGGTL